MTGARRLSQAISEGDGISVLVQVADATAATRAEEQGADGVAHAVAGAAVREATGLPILFRGRSPEEARQAGADGWVLVAESVHEEGELLEELHGRALELGLECVVDVRDEEEIEQVLERIDPEIFMLSPRDADDDADGIDRVLELLPDVPAGKLAIAELPSATRDDVFALERAGVDAVLVALPDVADLVGGPPPDV